MPSSLSPAIDYHPRGTAIDLWESNAPEVLISGPAGTGKSLACLWKLHYIATEMPGVRALILRKTRHSLTDSALVTFERDVLVPGHPALAGAHRANRHAYRYPNGSEVVCGGMDKAGKVMSTEYDLVYVQEATELSEEEWEHLTTRLRNNRLPYQQLLADCNPDRPGHWLKRRCDNGRTVLLESRHEDNPTLWDGATWTPRGADYLAKLDALTGPRRLRLRYGRWVQAEGVVYDGYDPRVHLLDRFPVPRDWPRLWSVDFGYTNPFVWQQWAIDPDGRLYRTREIYHTRRLVEDHAARIRQLTASDPPPAAVVCDHDAEGRATLERHLDIDTSPADKSVREGIQSVAARLRRAGDGRPRLFFLRDSLDRADPELEAAGRPTCTEEEFDGYVWDQKRPDQPVKADDHGMDATRYLVWTLDGESVPEETTYRRLGV